MARTPVSNESFYREVDEGVRRDQVAGVWRRYGRLLVAGLVLLLLLVAGALWWRNRQEQQAGQAAETLTKGLDQLGSGRAKAAAATAAPLAEARGEGYRAAARLLAAAAALEAGDDKRAAAAFGEMAADEGLAEPYRQLALVRQTAIEYDGLSPTVIEQRMRPLARPGSPWFGSAGEMLAVALINGGKRAEAGQLLARMARDRQVPETIRNRSGQLAGSLGVDVPPAATPAPAAPAVATEE